MIQCEMMWSTFSVPRIFFLPSECGRDRGGDANRCSGAKILEWIVDIPLERWALRRDRVDVLV